METGLSHWSSRQLAGYLNRAEGVSVSWHYVAKLWRDNGLAPIRLPKPPGGLTVVQSTDDEAVFETIGWFHSQQDLEAMRQNDDARVLLERLVALCSEFRPTAHRVVYSTAGSGW